MPLGLAAGINTKRIDVVSLPSWGGWVCLEAGRRVREGSAALGGVGESWKRKEPTGGRRDQDQV